MRTRAHAWAFALATGLACGACGDDDDDTGSRLDELTRIGPEGGTFALEGLAGVVPEGAVENGGTAVISGEIADEVTPPPGAVGPVYALEIDQPLREPITLELFYENADLEGRSALALRVASSRDGIVWDCEPMTAPREQTSSVLATVNHMSFWVLRFNPCGGDGDCAAPETCFDPGPRGYCAMPCAGDADCPSPTFCQCGICSRASCAPPEDDCPAATDCSVVQGRGVCLPECTPFDRCGDPEEQQLCSPGGRCAFQQSALCPDLFACDAADACVHQWCVPRESGCTCGEDPGCSCEPPAEECPPAEHEACANGEDDDGDELVDCLDVDCADEPGCTAGAEENCDAPGDEDGDGLVDCEDPDCAGDAACAGGPWPIEVITYGRRGSRAPRPEDSDWVAFQDGDRPWTELPSRGGGVYRASVQDPDGRYGIARGCADARPTVHVQYAVATEGGALRVPGCSALGGQPVSRVSGTVIGGDCYTINVHNQTLAPCYVPNYFADVTQGPVDVFAASATPGDIFDRAFLARDIQVAGPVNVTIDFDGPSSFALERHSRSSTAVWIVFRTWNDSFLTFGFGSELLEYGGVPRANQVEGEGHVAFVGSLAAIENIYFRTPVDLVASPAPPNAPEATGVVLAEEPHRLVAADAEGMPVGVSALEIAVTGEGAAWAVRASADWLGGGRRVEMPDLSALPSWLAAYGLSDTFNATLNVYWVPPEDLVDCFNAPAHIGLAREGLRCVVGSSQVYSHDGDDDGYGEGRDGDQHDAGSGTMAAGRVRVVAGGGVRLR